MLLQPSMLFTRKSSKMPSLALDLYILIVYFISPFQHYSGSYIHIILMLTWYSFFYLQFNTITSIHTMSWISAVLKLLLPGHRTGFYMLVTQNIWQMYEKKNMPVNMHTDRISKPLLTYQRIKKGVMVQNVQNWICVISWKIKNNLCYLLFVLFINCFLLYCN